MQSPSYLWVFLVFLNLAIVGVLVAGVAGALRRRGFDPVRISALVRRGGGLLLTWLAGVAIAASLGAFQSSAAGGFPFIVLPIALPVALGAWWLARSSEAAEILAAVPQEWLVGVQVYRGAGAIFLLLYGLGRLPGIFALPAGFGDVAVGLAALAVAIAWNGGFARRRSLVLGWNLFGLADLIVAVATGFLSAPTPYQLLAHDLPNVLAGAWPLSVIPTFAVPLSVILHLASLTKLAREGAITRSAPSHGAARA